MRRRIAPIFAAAFFVLSGCGSSPAVRPAPKPSQAKLEAPLCVPAAGLTPGSTALSPAFDAIRTAAINDLLLRISTCRPLPFDHDGIVFGNREGRLPAMPRGHYREYTLVIPGRKAGDTPIKINVGTQALTTGEIFSPRGPERLVIGGVKDIYYTPDHYESFTQLHIVP